jgi:DNA-binding NtrC family response regulator
MKMDTVLPGNASGVLHVLVVDDERFVRDSLTEMLRHAGFAVSSAASVAEARVLLTEHAVHVVVSDLRMPKQDGLELLRDARRAGVKIPIVMITGVGTVAEAVAAMKEGAYDFLQKPVDPAALAHAVRRAGEHFALTREVRTLRGRVARAEPEGELVGHSPALERVRARIAQVAASAATVLVTGESGTGKQLAARALHAGSARSAGPFVVVNCAALVESEFEAELFGARAGPAGERDGRVAEAAGGTLVFDEIGALKPALQAKLLRVLETGEYQPLGAARAEAADVRVIAITNDDLAAAVKAGHFRADLYHRIQVVPLALPPLREHKQDLPAIATHLLARAESRRPFGGGRARLTPDALEVLARYDWPGNVRELENVLERAQILAPVSATGELDAEFVQSLLETPLTTPRGAPGASEFHLRRNLDALEKEIVQRAIAHTAGKKKEAALLLGIDPRNLGYYLRKHKLSES